MNDTTVDKGQIGNDAMAYAKLSQRCRLSPLSARGPSGVISCGLFVILKITNNHVTVTKSIAEIGEISRL